MSHKLVGTFVSTSEQFSHTKSNNYEIPRKSALHERSRMDPDRD